jgi:hypothetical protein
MDNKKVLNWAGFAGAGVFNILNLVTNGAVPGGFIGAGLGCITGYILASIVLASIPSKKLGGAEEQSEAFIAPTSSPNSGVRVGLSTAEVERIMGSPQNTTSDEKGRILYEYSTMKITFRADSVVGIEYFHPARTNRV